MTLLTTVEVAQILGITRGRVHQLLQRLERKPAKKSAMFLWTGADVHALQALRKTTGRPRKHPQP